MKTNKTLNWVVVKSNKTISASLSKKLNNIRFGWAQENTFSFYYLNKEDLENILMLLKSFKRQKFEVIEFTEKQFGLSINTFSSQSEKFQNQVSELPLSKRFYWFNSGCRQTVTPITQNQFDKIIKVNY